MKEKNIILLRGLPGSGKSTLGLLITGNPQHLLSADDYFTDENGVYNFDVSKIKLAHEDCKQRCDKLMKENVDKIVIANTFTQEWEMSSYLELAQQYSYRVHSIIVENRHNGINIHNVPEETMTKMKERFEIKL